MNAQADPAKGPAGATSRVGGCPAPPTLPGAILPVLARSAGWMIEHTGPDGRLATRPGGFGHGCWYALSALAVVYTRPAADNPLAGDGRLADLIRRGGRTLAAEYSDPALANPQGWWYEPNRFDEWIVEHWLLAYELLCRAGADDLVAGWQGPLRRAGEVFDRYCRQVEHLRRMTSPNLKISTNHFAYFAADLIHLGQVFGNEEHVRLGLAVARKIAECQHPDGYWPETHGPTTSYNMISAAAMGLFDRYTNDPIFERALRRALDFHLKFSYPDGTCLETIDQRVRYPSRDSVFALHAFSRWPEGRGWAEARFAETAPGLMAPGNEGACGRLAVGYVYYLPGPATPPLFARQPAYTARLSDLPGGIVKREPWAVGLCGIPSRPRDHLYTLDRQNLLSIWHRNCGLLIGGGNSRDDHASATFYASIANDPTALVHGVSRQDAYVPVDGRLELADGGGSLDLEYWGFDARLAVQLVDERTCRVSAFAGTLPANDPVLFNPNILLDPAQPLRTGSGLVQPTGEGSWTLDGGQLGGWLGQGCWRIELPGGAAGCTLRYPVVPFRPNPAAQAVQRLAVLSVPVTNRTAELIVRVD